MKLNYIYSLVIEKKGNQIDKWQTRKVYSVHCRFFLVTSEPAGERLMSVGVTDFASVLDNFKRK